MPDTYVIKNPFAPHFLTFQVVPGLMCLQGRCTGTLWLIRLIFVSESVLNVYALLIMSNHVHCILSSSNGTYRIQLVI